MRHKKFLINDQVILKTFLGTLSPQKKINTKEDYWKLIGEKGKVITENEISDDNVLVLFKKDLDDFNLINHNPIRNSLFIKKSDLELDYL